MSTDVDCLVVGAGPAGLTAALYIARFHLRVCVIDAGNSRARQIVRSHNLAGFPDGIAGEELLERMQSQARRYGVAVRRGTVGDLQRADGVFRAMTGTEKITAAAVLIATGVENIRPPLGADQHEQALKSGCLRYCPVCDGYEVTDRKIGVYGSGENAVNEAEFLRSYSANVSLLIPEKATLAESERSCLAALGIEVVPQVTGFALDKTGISVRSDAGRIVFDTIYPALGSAVRSELAVKIGAETTDDGCIKVDSHQRTTIPGLYAAGDVVVGLDQISHAIGGGAVAGTAIRNDLASSRPLLR